MKIECAAIRSAEGVLFKGRSHAVCYQAMKEKGVPRLDTRNCEQGFVTDSGNFVNRHEAAAIAFVAGQTKKLEDPLFSEDITGDWPWATD